jgi:hypothetical protein
VRSLPSSDSVVPEPPPKNAEQPPRRLIYNPQPIPADLTPEARARITRVSSLIEQIAPGEEMPEAVFGVIEAALRKHYGL